MSTFFDMGGYAAFIWPCYALTLLAMIWLVVSSVSSMRRNEKLLDDLRGGSGREGRE